MTGFQLFETGLGTAALVWGGDGIRRTLLPERDAAETAFHVRRLFPDATAAAAPHPIGKAIADMAALIGGARVDLRDAPLDMAGLSPFARAVYEALRRVGPGETTTYGALAEAVGARGRGEARAVGVELGRNPFPVIVPCHRVLAAHGGLGGFSAPGGTATKLALLNIEQARTSAAPGLFAAGDLPLAARQRKS